MRCVHWLHRPNLASVRRWLRGCGLNPMRWHMRTMWRGPPRYDIAMSRSSISITFLYRHDKSSHKVSCFFMIDLMEKLHCTIWFLEAAEPATYQKMMLINLSLQLSILLITKISNIIYKFCHGHGIFPSIHHTLFGKYDITVQWMKYISYFTSEVMCLICHPSVKWYSSPQLIGFLLWLFGWVARASCNSNSLKRQQIGQCNSANAPLQNLATENIQMTKFAVINNSFLCWTTISAEGQSIWNINA